MRLTFEFQIKLIIFHYKVLKYLSANTDLIKKKKKTRTLEKPGKMYSSAKLRKKSNRTQTQYTNNWLHFLNVKARVLSVIT